MLVLDDYENEETEEERKQREEKKKKKKEEKKKKKEDKRKQNEELKKEVKEENANAKYEDETQEFVTKEKSIKTKNKDTKEENKKDEIKEERTVEIKENKKEKVKKEKVKGHKFRNFMLFLIFLIFAGALTLGLLYLMSPYKLELNGEKEVTISYGSTYEDPGAVVKRFLFVINKSIDTTGEVDTNKIGSYEVKYSSDSMSITRTIHVVDNEAPVIMFDEEEPFILNVNGSLKELDVDVYDLYEEDIEDVEVEGNVDITKIGEYEVKYKACDSSNNYTSKIRKVIVKDTEAPKITINKGDITLILGEEKYQEYGATAKDNYDTNLGSINIEGKVDENKEGTYEIKYSICDGSNNCSEEIRKVTVKKIDIFHGTFESYPEFEDTLPATLVLDGTNRKATLTVNYCEGLGDLYGTYSVSGNKLTIKLDHDWYDDSVLTFSISGNNKLKLETDFMACSPRQNEIFTRS